MTVKVTDRYSPNLEIYTAAPCAFGSYKLNFVRGIENTVRRRRASSGRDKKAKYKNNAEAQARRLDDGQSRRHLLERRGGVYAFSEFRAAGKAFEVPGHMFARL